MAAEARLREEKDRRTWEAFLSWRAQPPTQKVGKERQIIPFDVFLAQLGLGDPVEPKAPEVSDEEIERFIDGGSIGFFPPGMKG